jgi:CMD domain protein
MTSPTHDIIDLLVGIEPGSHLDEVRTLRPEARDNAQKSFRALFEPGNAGDVTLQERYAVATFVAGLHRRTRVTEFYASGLRDHAGQEFAAAVAVEIARGEGEGPYGRFPAGPLSAEDKTGANFTASEDARRTLGSKLAAAFDHAHLLVFRPRDASPEALQKLLAAGWSIDGIVTLSQLVSFLAFQIRVIAGLRALARNTELRAAEMSSLNAALASGGSL